jgi:hypothetical protein
MQTRFIILSLLRRNTEYDIAGRIHGGMEPGWLCVAPSLLTCRSRARFSDSESIFPVTLIAVGSRQTKEPNNRFLKIVFTKIHF